MNDEKLELSRSRAIKLLSLPVVLLAGFLLFVRLSEEGVYLLLAVLPFLLAMGVAALIAAWDVYRTDCPRCGKGLKARTIATAPHFEYPCEACQVNWVRGRR